MTTTGGDGQPIEGVQALPGARLLRRQGESSWAETLEPIVRDTADLPQDVSLGLDFLDWLVHAGLQELARHPFPETILHFGPNDPLDATYFASFLVAHRAERLVQMTELSAGALDNLRQGSLQLAAVASRALLEIAAASYSVHSEITPLWHQTSGTPAAVREMVVDAHSDMWLALWKARLGTRSEAAIAAGWPSATSVQTRLGHFKRADKDFTETMKQIYELLCEATHPNGESHAVLWRIEPVDSRGRHRVRFEPSASQSPVKLVVVDAVRISYILIVEYCRDLWRIATEVVSACSLGQHEDMRGLGLPRLSGRNDLCCCGSGLKSKVCGHPDPVSLRSEWENFQSTRR